MKCPTPQTLLAAELGELTYNETLAIQEHASSCAQCRNITRENRELLADLGAPPPFSRTEDELVSAVMSRCALPEVAFIAPKRRLGGFGYFGAAVAAGLALWFFRPAPPEREHWAARGTAHQKVDPVAVAPWIVRNGAALPVEGTELRAGDGITARYWNATAEVEYLALFVLDAKDAVHWIFPAYLDAATNPQSIPMAPNREGRLLPEAVEPEDPAPGRLRLVAIVSKVPLSVKDIEAKLVAKTKSSRDRLSTANSLAEVFPQHQVREWSSAWVAR